MTTSEDEIDEEDGRWKRLEPPSSATYFGRWGPHAIAEPLYRKAGVHNGPTMKPIERRAGDQDRIRLALNIERSDFHGDWNYTIRPRVEAR